MSEIKVYGTLVDETVENKVAYANQVYHVRKEKDVATLLDELTDTVAQIPAPTEQNYKGRITITDLLAISDSNKGENDLYLVYSSGNDEEGWSNDSTFNLNGIDYPDETFVQWVSGEWRAISDEDANTYKALVFDQPQDKVSLIYSTYGESSYDHLYGRWRDGLKIADVYNYTLDKEEGVYKPDYEVQEGRYGGKTNIKTIVIPWCRSYASGLSGMTRNYTGGLLKDVDYERLMESARVFVLDSEKTTSVTTIDTNGTAPYNSSYGTTELVVNNNGVAIEIREGLLLSITNKQLSIDQDHRNVRIKFTSATNITDPIPLFDVDGTILDGYKEIQPGKTTNLFQYRIGMSTGNGFYKILTEGNIKEIRLNGQSVENEDGIINLEVDSTSSKSLQTRAPMSTNSWNTIVTNTVGANPADTFENTIWEEVGYFTTTGITEDVIKSIVLSVRGERDSDIFSTVGCQVNLGYSNNEFTVNSLGCTVDNPELDKLFALGYNKVTERLSLFVRRKNAAQRVYLFCISSEMIFTQSSDTSWYSYSNLVTLCDGNNQNNPGLKLSSYSGQFSISIGSNIYNVDSEGNIDLGAFPDHHLKSNFSQYTGWSEVGYASYDDFYNFKKSIIFSISERSQLSSGVTSTNVQDNCSGILKISLFGTTNYNNYRFDFMSCTVDNSRLVDKIRLTYDKNAASDKNIKLYVKCDFPYQEWLLQDLSGNSPFIRTEHESGSNDYIANVTKPTTGQIVSSTFDGGGTITEVQLNGNTVSTSGVANIQALPLSYFYSSSNNGTVYTNQWREIAYFIVEDVSNTLSFSQVFSVRERLGTLDKHSGILTFGMRVDHGSVTHLVCNVDNPNLDGLFKAVYNNATGRCSIFGKTIGGWNSWGLTTISNANHFHQGLDALTAEPTSVSSGMITAATCYSSGGEGTITEVQLYGNTVSTSGVANIIPQTKMSTVGNGYSTKWKEISNYVNIPVSTTYLETFVAQTLSSSAECRGGIITVEIKTTSSGTIDTLRCYTDNSVLTNYFRVTYDNATRICRIYSGSYSSWNLVGISGESKFVQSSTATSTSSSTYRTLSEITPSSGTIVTPVCYIASFSQVQADWNNTVTTDPSYINNKPDILSYTPGVDRRVPFQTGNLSISTANSPLGFSASGGIYQQNSTADGQISTALGYYTNATGARAMSIGQNTTASAQNSFATGTHTTASGNQAVTFGTYTEATAGNTIAAGNFSIADDINMTAIGSYNLSAEESKSLRGKSSSTRLLFAVGDGTATNRRSNALEVWNDGSIYAVTNGNVVSKIGRPLTKIRVEYRNGTCTCTIVSGFDSSVTATCTYGPYGSSGLDYFQLKLSGATNGLLAPSNNNQTGFDVVRTTTNTTSDSGDIFDKQVSGGSIYLWRLGEWKQISVNGDTFYAMKQVNPSFAFFTVTLFHH